MNILNFFTKAKEPKKREFADLFLHTSEEEQKAIFLEMAKKASQRQKDLLKKYEEQLSAR